MVDQRYSTYTLAWEGQPRVASRVQIELDKSLPEVLAAIERGSLEEIEWALARIIFIIHERESRFRQRWWLVIGITSLYAAVALVTLLVLLLLHRP
jgi:hypothetical protein